MIDAKELVCLRTDSASTRTPRFESSTFHPSRSAGKPSHRRATTTTCLRLKERDTFRPRRMLAAPNRKPTYICDRRVIQHRSGLGVNRRVAYTSLGIPIGPCIHAQKWYPACKDDLRRSLRSHRLCCVCVRSCVLCVCVFFFNYLKHLVRSTGTCVCILPRGMSVKTRAAGVSRNFRPQIDFSRTFCDFFFLKYTFNLCRISRSLPKIYR